MYWIILVCCDWVKYNNAEENNNAGVYSQHSTTLDVLYQLTIY